MIMVLSTTEYNENYFNGRNTGVRLLWGYADILELGQKNRFDIGQEGLPYNGNIKKQLDLLNGIDLTGLTLLDVGGAVGNYASLGKQLGITTWDILDLNIDSWCQNNVSPDVDTYFTGNALVELANKQTFKANSYDVIFTSQFLECIDDVDLPDLISEMNRVCKTQQVHMITTIGRNGHAESQAKYNLKTLAQWGALGFAAGTRLIDFHTLEVLVV